MEKLLRKIERYEKLHSELMTELRLLLHSDISLDFNRNPNEQMPTSTLLPLWNMTTRLQNALTAEGIKTVGDAAQLTEAEMRCVPGIGNKSIRELKDILFKMGHSFQ